MLTPRFKLSQDESHVYITVHAPYTNITDTEIDVDGENFLFVSSPYFLRLRLPGKIVEDEEAKGSYSCDNGEFNLTFKKVTPGDFFENLDMITSLLAPRDIPDVNPTLVEMLEEDRIVLSESAPAKCEENIFSYGFASKVNNEFKDIGSEFPQIFELKAPEQISLQERQRMRKECEAIKFSSDHYLADFFDIELIDPYITVKIFWDNPNFNKDAEFTEEEVSILKELPNKQYLLTKKEYKEVLLGLIDILFGYCYDKRTTLNESTVESSWTINKLSSTLSWFCVFSDTKEVLIACYRRALIFPIFRNFELCNNVKNDLVQLLKKGKKLVIKCLIEIHQMFNLSNDARYILNQLYIKDYLVFLQKCRNEDIDELRNNIQNIELTKNDLDLELDELESAAKIVEQEEVQIMENEMAVKMASMTLLPGLKKTNGVHFDDGDNSSTSWETTSDSSSDDSSESLDSDDDPS